MNNVYLLPHDDGTYEAYISPVAPSEKAALLTAEGEYPVECYYRRHDLNGDGIIESYTCSNREELIDRLSYDGQSLHTIRSLWNYDSYKGTPEDVCAIFNAALEAWMELASMDDALVRCYSKGQPIATPTVKELIAILSKLPENYRVTCCGTDGFLHLFEHEKFITIDTEQYLT